MLLSIVISTTAFAADPARWPDRADIQRAVQQVHQEYAIRDEPDTTTPEVTEVLLCAPAWQRDPPDAVACRIAIHDSAESNLLSVLLAVRDDIWTLIIEPDGDGLMYPHPRCPSIEVAERELRRNRNAASLSVVAADQDGRGEFVLIDGTPPAPAAWRVLCRYRVKTDLGTPSVYVASIAYDTPEHVRFLHWEQSE